LGTLGKTLRQLLLALGTLGKTLGTTLGTELGTLGTALGKL